VPAHVRELQREVAMWSYPIITDGLIYVIDLRNGLYVLKYTGRFEKEINKITFLEGNSNQGYALCYEPVGHRPRLLRLTHEAGEGGRGRPLQDCPATPPSSAG
jgi:hypothetical protein